MRVKYKQIFKLSSLHKLYLALALIFGLVYVFIIPPMMGYDEVPHFYRAYQLSEGDIFANKSGEVIGASLPKEFSNLHSYGLRTLEVKEWDKPLSTLTLSEIDYLKNTFPGAETIWLDFRGAAVYAPTSYIGSVIGILIAKIFDISIYGYVILARIGSLLLVVALFYLAIKKALYGKLIIFFLALLPITLTQSSTVSADGVLLGATALLVVCTVNLVTLASKGKDLSHLAKSDFALLSLSILLIGLAKPGYAFLTLPLLALPFVWKNRGNRLWKKHSLVILALVAMCFALAPLWQALQYVVGGFFPTALLAENSGRINSAEQLSGIIQGPFGYAWVLLDQYVVNPSGAMLVEMFGWVTSVPIVMPYYVIILSYIVAALLFLSQDNIGSFRKKEKLLIYSLLAAVVSLTFIAINTALYLTSSAVGTPHIFGVQPRYFLPLMFLAVLLPLWKSPPIKIKTNFKFGLILFCVLFFFLVSIMRIVDNIYIR